VLRVPDECAYYKEDAGKMMLGAFEPKAKPWGMNGIPEDFCFDALPEDFEHFEPILEMAMHRMPLFQTAGVHTFFNGPESFTPDDRYYLGEAPELGGYWVAAGYNSIGIVSSGGAGMALAQWIVEDGRAALRSVGRRHPPRPAVPAQPPLSARARLRDAGPALRRPLSLSAAGDRAGVRRSPCTST
jgi:glycine/D-amino acid oxidase-like deaminating enzyme